MTFNELLETLSTSTVKLTNIEESSHQNGVIILYHAINWKENKRKMLLMIKKET